MPQKNVPISGVPTNIITGFLGVGKTSAILQLLKSKLKEERWAILVNEFGEIGIDGELYEGEYSEQQGVYIREVPGGCMCCTAGLSMQVALAQLLRRAKPDRLLIEPTGLGHPMEVLQTLNSESFRGVLSIQKIVTLVDARHLSDSRYIQHETFKQQIAMADIIVGNKQDLYADSDKAMLKFYLKALSLKGVYQVFTEQGVIEPALLEGPSIMTVQGAPDDHQHTSNYDAPIPECGFIKAVNQGEGFMSVGWRFSSRLRFDRNKLFTFLSGVSAERLKATLITNSGNFAYNLTRDALTETPFDNLDESRIEVIAYNLNESWESQLFDCFSNKKLISEVTQ